MADADDDPSVERLRAQAQRAPEAADAIKRPPSNLSPRAEVWLARAAAAMESDTAKALKQRAAAAARTVEEAAKSPSGQQLREDGRAAVARAIAKVKRIVRISVITLLVLLLVIGVYNAYDAYRTVRVPDVAGRDPDAANAQLTAAGLKPVGSPAEVCGTHPDEGTKAQRGEEVELLGCVYEGGGSARGGCSSMARQWESTAPRDFNAGEQIQSQYRAAGCYEECGHIVEDTDTLYEENRCW